MFITIYYIYLCVLWLSNSVLNSILEHHFQKGKFPTSVARKGRASPGRTCDFNTGYLILKAIRQNASIFHLRKSGWGLMDGNPTRQLGRVLDSRLVKFHWIILEHTQNISIYIYINMYISICIWQPCKIYLKIYHIEVFELNKSPTILVSPFGRSGQTKHASAVVIPLL